MMPVPDLKAEPAKLARRRVKVGFILLPGFTMFSYSALVYILKHCTDPAAAVGIDFEYVVLGQKPAQTTCGVQVPPTAPLHAARDCNYVFVIGGKTAAPVEDRRSILEALTSADMNGATLVGTGSGLFALIEAGFFDRLPCATDWYRGADRDTRFAEVQQISGMNLVVSGRRVSCAGGLAALELGSWLLERHYSAIGAEIPAPQELSASAIETGENSGTRENPLDSRVVRALKIIENNLGREPVKVESLASSLGISKRQIERLFQQEMKQPVQQYCRNFRLAYGYWLLLNSSKSITDIATITGFSDSSHFNRCFRAQFATTPSLARQSKASLDDVISPQWASLYERIVKSDQDLELSRSRKSVYTNLAHSVVGSSNRMNPDSGLAKAEIH
ncbi:GlxA family transcriptional regulator [Variovorax sp. OV084]|jgi:transcriptional regulator GlxA family with amidase domain|uniref:GlxA family transcriptional regulator n=1 Tax=Variovorax sp. OV084 TaxID=1882777 RepID=UPI0008D27DDC|nr:helix-turn-helix domain-containing protein [Variovorax sp. OV084]SET81761.1 transcriptional regulator, AraC family with amidase-like domain [Variovorax sp. OV084]